MGEPQEIAYELGIPYPVYPGTDTPKVLTSDIVATYLRCGEKVYEVFSVKRYKNINPPEKPGVRRIYELILIEKIYWERRNILCRLSTERDIQLTRAQNLDMLRNCLVSKELDYLSTYMPFFLESFNENWMSRLTLNEILDRVSKKIKLDSSDCFTLFGRAVWLRLLPVDLDSEEIGHQYRLLRKKEGCGDT